MTTRKTPSATVDWLLMLLFAAVVLTMPLWLAPFGANYPDLMQKFAIFGVFAIGFNILFGLTGYLSFGHAAFLGVGSYAAVWSFKLLTMNVLPAMLFSILTAAVFAVVIGFVSLRRSGIYFSILTLAFAQMSYKLAYSVLTPITNGETGLQLALSDPRVLDAAVGIEHGRSLPRPSLFGFELTGMAGFWFCAVMLIIAMFVSLRIFRSPFGMMLMAIKSNQTRMAYTGFDTRPYLISAFVISGMFAGLAGAMMCVTDPLAGAERMQWTASGEVVLMTILGGAGTLIGPVLGAGILKYFENIFSAFNRRELNSLFESLPDGLQQALEATVGQDFVVSTAGLFVGEGWHLTLGLLFMTVVIFLPGGIMEGLRRIGLLFGPRKRTGAGGAIAKGTAGAPGTQARPRESVS